MRSNQFSVSMVLFVTVMLMLVGCGGDSAKDESGPQTIVFDSGHGSDPLNKMTYWKYQSEILFTPEANMSVSSIKPAMWYCSGICGYTATIQDESHGYLASQSGSIAGNNTEDVQLPIQYLDSVVQMNTGTTYRIILEAWTTKSVGIYTTGDRTTGISGQAHYSVEYARSIVDAENHTVDMIDRGSISFQLLNKKE